MLSQSTYCPNDAVVALQFLQHDSTPSALSGDRTGWNNYLGLVGHIQNHSFSQSVSAPTGAAATDAYFTNTFCQK